MARSILNSSRTRAIVLSRRPRETRPQHHRDGPDPQPGRMASGFRAGRPLLRDAVGGSAAARRSAARARGVSRGGGAALRTHGRCSINWVSFSSCSHRCNRISPLCAYRRAGIWGSLRGDFDRADYVAAARESHGGVAAPAVDDSFADCLRLLVRGDPARHLSVNQRGRLRSS